MQNDLEALSNPSDLQLIKTTSLLKWYEANQSTSLSELTNFITDSNIRRLADDFSSGKITKIDLGFNVFEIVTDTFKKENLHSHIIKSFLDPQSSHGEGYVFLNVFLSFLQELKAKINLADYQHAEVRRERDRIDISIIDPYSKRAIIIENKLNRAGDQYRQIPKYVELLEDVGYTVDAVLYLVPGEPKSPSHEGWTDLEKEVISKKTVVVSTFRHHASDLVHGWIDKCINKISNIDALVLLRQYRLILQKISNLDMNKHLMEQFHQLMLTDSHFKNALSLREMINGLVNYRVQRIIDTFHGNTEPFNKGINRWQDIAYMEDTVSNLVIDIGVYEDKYIVEFFNRKFSRDEIDIDTALPTLQALGMEDQFEPFNKKYKIRFKFPEEEQKMYDFIKDFKKKLILHLGKTSLN